MESLNALIQGMGLMHLGAGQAIMLLVSLLLLWLAIAKKFEPLLLLPIGFGGLLSNIPEAGLALTALESLLAHHDPAQLAVIAAKLHCAPDVHAIKEALALALPSVQGQMESLAVDMGYSAGVLAIFYKVAIGSGIAPLVIFMGVGAMTDFGPLLANPRTLLLGAAAQFGIFATVLGALTLNYFGIISFTLPQAAAIGIIGGADGPTAIYLSGKLAPELLGAIAVAAYSYMALVPLIQPPIMKALTTDKERKIRMVQLRTVSKREDPLPGGAVAAGGAPAAGRRAAAGDVLLRQPDARERRGGAAERYGAERADQHRHHLPRAVGGGQAGGGQVPAAADAGDPGAGGDRLLRGDRRRGADGEADERVQPAQNQPADRLGGGVGGADGGAGVEQGGSGSGRAELPADARDGPERGGGDRLGDRRRGDAQVRAGDVGRHPSRRCGCRPTSGLI